MGTVGGGFCGTLLIVEVCGSFDCMLFVIPGRQRVSGDDQGRCGFCESVELCGSLIVFVNHGRQTVSGDDWWRGGFCWEEDEVPVVVDEEEEDSRAVW